MREPIAHEIEPSHYPSVAWKPHKGEEISGDHDQLIVPQRGLKTDAEALGD